MLGRDSLRERISILWLRKLEPRYRRVSLNVLREVCTYLDDDLFLVPAICRSLLKVYNLQTKTVLVSTLSISLTEGAVFCFTGGSVILCVGGYSPATFAALITPQDGKVSAIDSMETARAWPGIYKHKNSVYVFGGNYPQISSCEKLCLRTKQWKPLPSMKYERYSFSPCLYGEELILADTFPSHKVVEAFHLGAETFRTLDVRLPSGLESNSAALIQDGELCILCDTGYRVQWKVTEGEMRVESLQKDSVRAYSPCPPTLFQDKLYFSNFERGQLVCFERNGPLTEVVDYEQVAR